MFHNETTPPTLTRLIALMDAGYRMDERASSEVGNTVWLEHPARKRVAEKTLMVFENGWVVGIDPLEDAKAQLRIGPENSEQFNRFLSTVPQSTWWERNNHPFYVAFSWVVIGTVMFASVQLLDFVWNTLLGK